MKRSLITLLTFLIIMLISVSCVSNSGDKPDKKEQGPPVEETVTAITGKQEYVKYCLTCHQEDGNGVRRQFPPLAGNELVTGNEDSLIRIVLFGLEGPVVVMGQPYNQLMPAQSYLTDQQISDVLTYIRYAWGNKAASVKSANVARIRAEKAESKN
jgi:mono/diheme cytochrome c family protein